MKWITVATPPTAHLDQVDAIIGEVGKTPDGPEARYVGTTSDGQLRIVSFWSSKEHADRFFTDTLGPAIAKVLGPEVVGASELVGIDVARSYTREPVG